MEWQAVSVNGQAWTIDKCLAQWTAQYSKRTPRFIADKATGVARVKAAIAANKHRVRNGEVPARILDWMDDVVFQGGE
jgi:hypothetical protein